MTKNSHFLVRLIASVSLLLPVELLARDILSKENVRSHSVSADYVAEESLSETNSTQIKSSLAETSEPGDKANLIEEAERQQMSTNENDSSVNGAIGYSASERTPDELSMFKTDSGAVSYPIPISVATDTVSDASAPLVNLQGRTAVITPGRLAGQVIAGLFLVTVLILLLAWLAKRFGYQQYWGSRGIKMVSQLPLGSRERVVLIEVNGEQMLLGVAPGRVNFLRNIDGIAMHSNHGEQTAVPIKKGQEFARYLKSILAQGKPS